MGTRPYKVGRERPSGEALRYAITLLSYRERSTAEIRERMLKRGYSQTLTLEIIEKLGSEGYLDDERFAEVWTRTRLKGGYGRRKVVFELEAKGVPPGIAETVVRNAYRDVDEFELAKRLVARKVGSRIHAKDSRTVRRFSNYLRRRGFSFPVVREVLRDTFDGGSFGKWPERNHREES